MPRVSVPEPAHGLRGAFLDVEILDGQDAFGVRLNYNAEKYDLGSVERFAECIRGFAAKMLKLDPGTASVADMLS
ncbi:MAG: hypothetical protein E7325_08345 [Clostridiales bacterium]|nr:hypothetical protein [Clostridiales bacterium]